jgi:hypothetical protein
MEDGGDDAWGRFSSEREEGGVWWAVLGLGVLG